MIIKIKGLFINVGLITSITDKPYYADPKTSMDHNGGWVFEISFGSDRRGSVYITSITEDEAITILEQIVSAMIETSGGKLKEIK